MTEQQWLVATYPLGVIHYLGAKASERKRNLFAAACFRRIWHLLPGPRCQEAVVILERFADGLASAEDLTGARQRAFEDLALVHNPDGNKHPSEIACVAVSSDVLLDMVMDAAEATAWVHVGMPAAISGPEEQAQCCLIRDVFGNPFKMPSIDSTWLARHGGTIPKIAQAIYEDRAFDHLPILADALEDAGCTDAAILDHCRQPGEHVRGCWVVDLLLGKS
jgi:hypothetical protein